ncbi:hypothetical protein SAMN05216249_10467 [Acetitomaculum ruminis DSM 5522]|uniref:DUF1492 domain-containing protein n=1 Tax=Acetitomaculum ruminis DSM 5522 TaxID=1120918 RepID=A0A1I0WIN1_9FIRM|nr:hypothetical protein [Acetitomaculum ruminis]SFA87806.1 hypothetical protein SAMN05216249_10467 [Acetitomaculum ruminis DSM 5522]
MDVEKDKFMKSYIKAKSNERALKKALIDMDNFTLQDLYRAKGTEMYMIKKEGLQEKLKKQREECYLAKKKVLTAISKLPMCPERCVLYVYYIKNISWYRIAKALNITERKAYKIRAAGLEMIELPKTN